MQGFILTRHWKDTPKGIALELWLSSDDGPVRLTIPPQQAVFFIRQDDLCAARSLLLNHVSIAIQELPLNNFHGEKLAAVYCRQQRQLRSACDILRGENITFWESDIRPVERFLMERFITASVELPVYDSDHRNKRQGHTAFTAIYDDKIKPAIYQPSLKVVSLDIETSMDAQDLYSIAVYGEGLSSVFMVGQAESIEQSDMAIVWCVDARECLQQFLAWLQYYDPDILLGWHVVQFDCWVLTKLCQRWQVPFTLGRNQQVPHWREEGSSYASTSDAIADADNRMFDNKRRYIQVPGRVILDGIELLRIAFYQFDSFSLQSVAKALLGEDKLLTQKDRGQAIADLFAQDKLALAQYNVKDCQLVWDIFSHTKLLEFAIERSQLTGLPMDKMGGSVASFEYAYLPHLHRKGYVAPNLGELESGVVSPGGYVMNSLPGLYQHVLVLDFKSLYPSIIRTFNIDPYAFWHAQHQQLPDADVVEGFNGAKFSRQSAILPDIIRNLWKARDKAKADNNKPLSHAIKIIMNSFYGVLGSTGCRFFDPRVCSSITLRGHEIIQKSHQWIEQQGYQVIYGDTDSLFVWLGDQLPENHSCDIQVIGTTLANDLNQWWTEHLQQHFSVESALEIEFETHYHDFLMPTIRGSDKGSKKRYAGTIVSNGETELVFKGLETVRADWTPLAKTFQQTLYRMIFEKQDYQHYIRAIVDEVLSGQCDDLLVYTKRLRRPVKGYEKSNPPHIKAAKKLESHSDTLLAKGHRIDYVITRNGPEPIEYRQSAIDYQHYIDKQLMPIADSILCFLDDSFAAQTQKQINLF